MSKRYFWFSVYTDGKTNEVTMSCNGFPSRAYVSRTIEDDEGSKLIGILSFFEFKSKADYESFLSGRETDKEEIIKPEIKVDKDKFVAYFNANCGNIPKIQDMTTERLNKLKNIISIHTRDVVLEVIKNLKNYAWLQGEEVAEGKKPWVATIDWVLNKNNFQKIKEGNYKTREVKKQVISV